MTIYATIRTSGKFRGELSIVPKMWDITFQGCSTEVYVDDTAYYFVSLADVDEPYNPELFGAVMFERSDGFICTQWYETEQEYDAAITALEARAESETDNV